MSAAQRSGASDRAPLRALRGFVVQSRCRAV